MTQLWETYCDWLLKEVGFTEMRSCGRSPSGARLYPRDYDILMRKLHDTDFRWVIGRDENRMNYGLSLRYDFFDDVEVSGGAFMRPCSVLEMLIGLAIRLDSEYVGDPGDPHPEELFWSMICNMRLNEMDNEHFNETKCNKILDIWLDREFRDDGFGSPFPLKNVTFDSTNEEIWKQAMAYLTENY